MRKFVQAAIGLLLCAEPAMASPAQLRIAGPLQSGPAPTAPATATLKAGTVVDIVQRKGFWAQVRGGGVTGWLKLNRLAIDSGNAGHEIAALASGRTGSNNVVSASGGRGLDAADIARAKPDTVAVAALPVTSEAAATQFAKSGGLKTRHVPYIRAPQSGSRR